MLTSELVFIPSPGAGHLPPMVELAKLLLHRDQRLSVTIIIMNLPMGAKHNTETPPSTSRLRLVDLPFDESAMALITPKTFLTAFVDHHKQHVRDVVRGITESNSARLAGFVVDMFCVAMTEVANEFGTPTYTFFASGAAMLGLMFYLQAKWDHEGFDVSELKNSEQALHVPGFINPVPAKVLPEVFFDKEGGFKMLIGLATSFRESKGIVVNTFQDLESHGLEYLISSNGDIPPVFAVGPIINLQSNNLHGDTTDEIMTWLNDQPERSVVFLCFGSMGSFNEKQVKEMAVALERSGQRFLWSLRCPAPKEKFEQPREYENLEEVFVWPLYAEQQLNAFQLVVELGMAAEIRMDYRTDMRGGGGSGMVVTAEEIEDGIRKLMSDGEMRKKVQDMKEKSRYALVQGGSSHASVANFIDHVLNATI